MNVFFKICRWRVGFGCQTPTNYAILASFSSSGSIVERHEHPLDQMKSNNLVDIKLP